MAGRRLVDRHQVWSLKEPLRSYVLGVPSIAAAALGVAIADTRWQLQQLVIFVALVACGTIAIEATRTVKEPQGTMARDLQSIWYLAIAMVLPPAYALAAPIPLAAYKLWRTRRMMIYRRVFSNATISLAYGGASVAFHAWQLRFGGNLAPGAGAHVLSWTAAVAVCGLLGFLINNSLLVVAIKLSDPAVRLRELLGSRESITSDLLELSLAVSLTLIVAINAVLMILALPSVVLCRRYLMRAQLVAQARLDAKTGLLNAGTWEREASAELYRAALSGTPLVLAMVGIDHFKSVIDTAGPQVGDQLLRDIAVMLKEQLPQHDLIGRLGGEGFAILLPRTGQEEARRLSERLRDHIAGEPIAIESGDQAGFVFRLTVSIGVAVMNESRRALGELVGAAGLALDQAKSTGWNKVCVINGDLRHWTS